MIDLDKIPQVALAFVNEDHRQMGEVINELMARIQSCEQGGAGREEVAGQLQTLLAHTRAHFAREEEQMQAHRFINYAFHKNGHDSVVAEMQEELDVWRARGDVVRLRHYVFDLLPNWFAGHIEVQDAMMADHIVRALRSA